MTGLTRLVLILFGLAYLISPVDLIPDLLIPWLGWIDDGVILWSIYYLIRYGELPWFLFQKKSGGRFTSPRPKNGRKEQPFSGNQTAGPKQQPASGHSTSENRNSRSKQAGPTGSGSARSARSSVSRSPREILGVSANASQKEIQRAYKEKIKQYHPDKLSHLGKEFADLANEKFLEIQAAYDSLMKK